VPAVLFKNLAKRFLHFWSRVHVFPAGATCRGTPPVRYAYRAKKGLNAPGRLSAAAAA